MARIVVDPEVQHARFNRTHFRRLLTFAHGYRLRMIAALAYIVVGAACQLSLPWLVQRGIDDHISNMDFGGLVPLTLAFVCILLVYLHVFRRRLHLMSWIGEHVLYRIRRQVFGHIQRLGFAFFERQPTGKIIARLTSDIRYLQQFLSDGLILLFSESLVVVGTVVVMLAMHPQLALASFTTLPVVMITVATLHHRIQQAHLAERDTMANVYANVQEAVTGVKYVQAYARQSVNEQHFAGVSDDNLRAALVTARRVGLLTPAVEVTSASAIIVTLWYASLTVAHRAPGEPVTVGVLVAFLAYVQQFYDPVRNLSSVYTAMQAAMASADRIFEILDTQPEVHERASAYVLPTLQGDVVMEHVSFKYSAGQLVLHDVSLSAAAGETVALIGPTGAGKTTIASLLARFHDPADGVVRMDGHDLRDATFASLRRQVAVVGQEPFLFSRTIRENLCFGRCHTTTEMVDAACAVGANDFISGLPQGYDTVVQERGESLSHGQRQLLAFTRALLMDPRVLILDEATSNVDRSTEARLQEAIDRLLSGRTAFVVAHRLSTIRKADRIVVVRDGRIDQAGTHDQLIATAGWYRDLVHAHRDLTIGGLDD